MRLVIDQAPRDRIRPTLPPPEADSYGTILPAQDGFLPLPSAQLRTNFHGGVAWMSGWRWRRDLNPRRLSPHTLSRSGVMTRGRSLPVGPAGTFSDRWLLNAGERWRMRLPMRLTLAHQGSASSRSTPIPLAQLRRCCLGGSAVHSRLRRAASCGGICPSRLVVVMCHCLKLRTYLAWRARGVYSQGIPESRRSCKDSIAPGATEALLSGVASAAGVAAGGSTIRCN